MLQRVISIIHKHREKQKKRSRLSRYTSHGITLLGCLYLLLLFFPQPLFAHSKEVGQFSIYSDRPIPAEIESVIRDATSKLQQSELHVMNEHFSVFLAHDQWRRFLLNPRASKAFGASLVFTGNTILNRCDIPSDSIYCDLARYNRRPMHAVIAHECVHHLMAKQMGLYRYVRLPTWKNEGYCEYVAGGPSFPVDRGRKLIREGRSAASPSFRYLTYRLATESALDDQKMTLQQFLAKDLDFESTLNSAVTENPRQSSR